MTGVKPTPEFDPLYELVATVPGDWPYAQAILLPELRPVQLEASFNLLGELPSGWNEARRSVAWQADQGKIIANSNSQESGTANWEPPNGSRLAHIEAKGEIILQNGNGETATVHKSVTFDLLAPALSTGMKDGVLDGYEIGKYLDPLKANGKGDSAMVIKHPDRYQMPSVFYRVDAAQKGLLISPRITLGHFVIDYPWGSLGMPQYVAIDPNLVRKLEELMDLINEDDKFKVTGLTPIYGFRSPKFNLGTMESNPEGNLKVRYSMHQYGRAMDFIIDEDGDLIMDDLNGDGKHDIYDAAQIMHYVNILDRKYRDEKRMDMLGGAGIYERHDFVGRPQSSYIHVDTRGFVGANGHLIRWKEPQPEVWPDGKVIKWSDI